MGWHRRHALRTVREGFRLALNGYDTGPDPESVALRFDGEIAERLRAKAAQAGLSPRDYIRRLVYEDVAE